VVIIYLENRSFNNLFANFPGLEKPLSGLSADAYLQKDRDGSVLPQLPKVWGGMVPRSQNIGGKQYSIGEDKIAGLPNAPFTLKDENGKPLPESVITRDLCHLFYQNQMQINGGKNDQFVAYGDSGALVMGYYGQTSSHLGLWKVAEEYTLCDNFFMAAFGGSYLNHQFLISSRTPEYFHAATTAAKRKIAVTADGPTGSRLALDPASPASALDGKPKYVNDGAITPDGYAVNTMAPPYQPSYIKPAPGGDPLLADPADQSTLPPQTYDTIGDLLSRKGVSWAWYGAAWQAALNTVAAVKNRISSITISHSITSSNSHRARQRGTLTRWRHRRQPDVKPLPGRCGSRQITCGNVLQTAGQSESARRLFGCGIR
jgi:acid phosphatase